MLETRASGSCAADSTAHGPVLGADFFSKAGPICRLPSDRPRSRQAIWGSRPKIVIAKLEGIP
jgi:hypothetical protein